MKINFRNTSVSFLVVFLAALLLFSACASGALITEVPFGSQAEMGPLNVSTSKTGEGEFLVVLSSTAPEDLKVDVRMGTTLIGRNYSSDNTGSNKDVISKFAVEGARTTVKSEWTREFPVTLTNWYQVTRDFHTILNVQIRGVKAKWRFEVPVEDLDLFADVKYLQQLNKTDYWHPRMIDDNWQRYLEHIEN